MTSRKKLLQLFNGRGDDAPSPTPDSAPAHRRFETVLAENGFDVETMAAYHWPWNPAGRLHHAYLGLDPLRALRVLTMRRDSIVCGHLESVLFILLLRRVFLFRPPVIIWEVPWSPNWKYREFVSRLAIPLSDCTVVFGSNQIARIHQVYGEELHVAFVPFCIDTDFYHPLPSSSGHVPYVLSCGLDSGRDFNILLAVADKIPARVILKPGRELDATVATNVTVINERLSYPAYRDMYAGAGIVVVTTYDTTNACGVTSLMEAMAMGKPVIVSDNPALRDYLPGPDAGIVIPIGDGAALQAAIIDLLGHPEKAQAMGQRAREFAETRFHPRRHYMEMTAMLQSVLPGEREP